MAINCRSCGQVLPDNSRFCAKCGQPVSPVIAEQAPASAESAQMAPQPAPTPRMRLPLKIIIPAAAALVTVIALGIGGFLYQNPQTPDLMSMSIDEATEDLEQSGLALDEVAYDAESDEATWTVIAQSPAPGTRTKRGTRVGLVLAGAPPTIVPDVTSLSRAQAESEIASATLTISAATEEYDSMVPAGAVISQEPTAGVSVPRGSGVSLLLSKGPQPVTVPNVVGATEADASAALQAAGFGVAPTPQDDAAPKGTVISQTPGADTLALPGTAVTIAVSTGVEMVKVPSWMSFNDNTPMTDEEYEQYGLGKAMDRLEAAIKQGFSRAGLQAVVTFDPDWTKDSYQTPKAGTMAPKGSTVKIMIYVAD